MINPKRSGDGAKVHSRRRGRERFGMSINRNHRATIRAAILSGRAIFMHVSTGSDTRHVYLAQLGRQSCQAVWDWETQTLITVIPITRESADAIKFRNSENED
jgi:hypothetical protein